MDLIQKSKVFWDVDAVSVGNVVHNRTPISAKLLLKPKILDLTTDCNSMK
jgi:hypothetical protein